MSRSLASVPVFHPDHPHNRHPISFTPSPTIHYSQPTPLGSYPLNALYTRTASASVAFGPPSTPPRKMRPREPYPPKTPGSDSDASATGSSPRGACFCGLPAGDGGLYCSVDCARSDAFSSLCYKPGLSRATSVESGTSASASASTSASMSASTSMSNDRSREMSASSTSATEQEWDSASHYRRVARADLRRDERREERRRRRAEGSVASTARSTMMSSTSSSASRVPDLIGGHSRNPSTASSVASTSSSWTSLSRNASSASTMSTSSRRGYRGDAVEVIQEDEDEEYLDSRPYPLPSKLGVPGHRRKASGHSKKRVADPLGMGKDMRDILEEIISMEKSFSVDDDDIADEDSPPPGLFTAVFDRPPRTPSPPPEKRVPEAPFAPPRGHRSSLSNPYGNATLGVTVGAQSHARPSSFIGGHQSSLSESHTALYLATASPVAASRRSASPQLKSRNSLTFDPETAVPIIPPVIGGTGRFDSPNMSVNITPSRRRPQISPNASYADMGGWRFPSSVTSSSLASTASGPAFGTPSSAQEQVTPRGPTAFTFGRRVSPPGGSSGTSTTESGRVAPHLLWPPPSHQLGASPFPTSPADTPGSSFFASSRRRAEGVRPLSPPRSGLRMGVMLGSGLDVGDVEMELEEDDESTLHGHGGRDWDHGSASGHGHSQGYLPVVFEAEDVRRARGW